MKQYLLSVHHVEGEPVPSQDQMQQMLAQTDALNDELRTAGAWVFAGGLFPSTSATVVRTENGATTTTDGPFVETKEQLGGFWIIQCADLDEALAWAEQGSAACMGPVEVRPFQDEAAD